MPFKFEHGVKVKETITGFSGVVTGRTDYISGCKQILVQPPVKKEGEFSDAHWFDEDRLSVVEDAPQIRLDVKTAGPDKPAPIR